VRQGNPYFFWAVSSAVEHLLDVERVAGSIPALPTGAVRAPGSNPGGRTMSNTPLVYIVVGLLILLGIFLIPGKDKNDGRTTMVRNTADPTTFEQVSATKAVIKTNKGDIELELYPDAAPKTVINFATLAKNGFYNTLTFHRVEAGFVIQGGDPVGNGTGGASIYGAKFEDEIDPESELYARGYVEGVLAMANSGPDTNSSQFFIMLGETPLPPSYTIFGKVTAGMDVVKKIAVGDKINTITVE
jgi:cyclophilin family peptidyl-prolyl cis-trans isomerase